MSDTVKLIIEIPKDFYEITKDKVDKNMTCALSALSIAAGIPLDDLKAEIEKLSNANPSYWHSGDMVEREEVLEILDNIGKGDKE